MQVYTKPTETWRKSPDLPFPLSADLMLQLFDTEFQLVVLTSLTQLYPLNIPAFLHRAQFVL